jgi:hypothetical protein
LPVSEINSQSPSSAHPTRCVKIRTDPRELTGTLSGTAAAGMQAGIGNVVAGSMFATAQSIAAGGAVPAAVTVAGAGITGITTAAAVGFVPSILSMGTASVSAMGAGIGAVANVTRWQREG